MVRYYCVLVLLLFYVANIYAAETGCPQHYAGGEAPDILDTATGRKELCYSGFAVMHAAATKTPLYAAEYLTRERLVQARAIPRRNSFHTEAALPAEERAELADYAGSGYDRGHLAPSADMPDAQSQYESFSLANIVPQVPAHNRGIWARLERQVRQLVHDHARVYIITGALFDTAPVRIGTLVGVPVTLYKVLYVPETGELLAFLSDNRADADLLQIDLQQLEQRTGIRFFPRLQPDHYQGTPTTIMQTCDAVWGGCHGTVTENRTRPGR